jgi:hypothetical protein
MEEFVGFDIVLASSREHTLMNRELLTTVLPLPVATFLGGMLLVLLVLLPACSSLPTGQPPTSVAGASPNLATVYFYRPQNSPGGAVGVDIKDNGIDIGTLEEGSYFVYHTNQGQHVLTATTDTASTQNFNLQAGAIYYMEAGVVSDQLLFQPSLSIVFDLQGQSAIESLKRLSYNE